MFRRFVWQEPCLGCWPHLPPLSPAPPRPSRADRHCLATIILAAHDHPDVVALAATLARFATDGALVKDETRPWRPLLHHAFDRAWQD